MATGCSLLLCAPGLSAAHCQFIVVLQAQGAESLPAKGNCCAGLLVPGDPRGMEVTRISAVAQALSLRGDLAGGG